MAIQGGILAQYTKDLSFENPNILKTLAEKSDAPEVSVNVRVNVQPLEDQIFEVALSVEAKGTREEITVFLIDLTYAGVIHIAKDENTPESALKEFLLVECPRLLFPFARQIVSDITQSGGLPPLMLAPINFSEMLQTQDAQSVA